jgi:stress-induced morphogen
MIAHFSQGVRLAARQSTVAALGRGLRVSAVSLKTPEELSIEKKLVAGLEAADGVVQSIEVEDISGGCGAQYRIECVSDKFAGMNTIKQHRLVNNILKEEIAAMHAVRIFTSSE